MSHPAIKHLRELSEKAANVHPIPWITQYESKSETRGYLTSSCGHLIVRPDRHEFGQFSSIADRDLVLESRNALPVLLDCLEMALEELNNGYLLFDSNDGEADRLRDEITAKLDSIKVEADK